MRNYRAFSCDQFGSCIRKRRSFSDRNVIFDDRGLRLIRDDILPKWNYRLLPQT